MNILLRQKPQEARPGLESKGIPKQNSSSEVTASNSKNVANLGAQERV